MLNLDRAVTGHEIAEAARELASEDGENPEYDRALTELIVRLFSDSGHGEDGASAALLLAAS